MVKSFRIAHARVQANTKGLATLSDIDGGIGQQKKTYCRIRLRCLLQSSPKPPNLLCRRAPWFCYRANQLQRSRGATILRIESRHRDKKASRSAYQSYLQRTRRNLEHQRWPATNTPLPEKTSVFGNEGLARGLRPQVPSRLGKPGLRPVSNERQPAEGLSLPQLGLGAILRTPADIFYALFRSLPLSSV